MHDDPGTATKQTPPRVSVLMTTYNGEALIRESIDSVLSQTLSDFELVIVDDCSTDGTPELLARYDDPRIRVVRPNANLGVVGGRNFGLGFCCGTYIAAHDHDDISLPTRLATQVGYLDTHPDVVLAGADVLVSKNANQLLPTDHVPGCTPTLVRWMLHVDNPLTYSSVMFRADAVRHLGGFMRPDAEPADDFDLYHRLLNIGALARLDETLTIYRWHARNTSLVQSDRMFASASAVLTRAYEPFLGRHAEAAARLVVHHLSDRRPVRDLATLKILGDFLERLLAEFSARHAPNAAEQAQIDAHIGRVWWRVVRGTIRSGVPRALGQYLARRSMRRGFTPPTGGVIVAVALGCIRTTHIGRVMTPRWRHRPAA